MPFTTREQELLLQAALLEGKDGINAWQKWKKDVNLEGDIDIGSYHLFPLLYRNLEKNNLKDPFMSRLRGIYRKAWYENQRLFYDMNKILLQLNNAGICTMVPKGVTLSFLYYKNNGVRPLTDMDILIPPSQVTLTIDVLAKAGWIPTTELTEADLKYRNSKQLKDNSGKVLNLFWHLLFDSCQPGADNDFWDEAVPLTIGEISILSLNPTDLLLDIIVHGLKAKPEPDVTWIADATSLINSSNSEINWIRFITKARKYRVVLQVKKALNYLQDTYQAPVPESLTKNINKIRISLLDILEYRYIMSDTETLSNTFLGLLLGSGPNYIMEYRHLHYGTRRFLPIIGLPKYLQHRMHKKNLHDLFSYLVLRGLRITKREIMARLKKDRLNHYSTQNE